MNLFDIISQAQGGQALSNLGRQFDLDPQQTEQAVKGLLPAFTKGIERNTEDEGGLRDLLGALQGGNHQKYTDDSSAFENRNAVDEGNGILGHIFGSKDVSRQVAGHVSQKAGLSESILKKMLPYIATLVMGALAKRAMGRGTKGVVDTILGSGARRSGGLIGRTLGSGLGKVLGGGLVTKMVGGYLMKRMFGGSKPTGRGLFGSLLDADGDGSWTDDVLGMAVRGMRR